MNVGDYVRTKNGSFTKIKAICEQRWKDPECIYSRVLCEDNEIYEYPKYIKSSPNIIDLIEKFDLVNGHLVINISKEQGKNIEIYLDTEDLFEQNIYNNDDIKSIVTHEQFSQMEYKVK